MYVKKKSLGAWILVSMFLGVCTGLLIRFNPNYFTVIHITGDNLKYLGDIFLNLISTISSPLIFVCIVSAMLSMHKVEQSKRVFFATLSLFIIMTSICTLIGIIIANIINPGVNVVIDTEVLSHVKDKVINNKIHHVPNEKSQLVMFLFNMIPNNFFGAFVNNNFIQIIFLAALFSMGILNMKNTKNAQAVIHLFTCISELCMSIITIIMRFAPFGIFGITAWLFAMQDKDLILSLGRFLFTEWLGGFVIIYVIYGLILSILKLNPLRFFSKIAALQFLTLVTASSASALPLAIDASINKLGVSKEKANFVLPFATMINTNGSAMHLAIATIFVSQLFHIDINMMQYITLFIVTVIFSLSTIPVPGGCLITLASVFSAVNLPLEAIGIIVAIDRISDMIRSCVNITGDIIATLIIDKKFNSLNIEMYSNK